MLISELSELTMVTIAIKSHAPYELQNAAPINQSVSNQVSLSEVS